MNAKSLFSSRFNEALDLMPTEKKPPAKGDGRQLFVAQMFGVSQKGARKWLEGEAIPNQKRMAEFEAKLKVSAAWLWTGNGSPALQQQPPSHQITALLPRATPRSRAMLESIAAAADAGRLTEQDLDLLQRIAQRFEAAETPAPPAAPAIPARLRHL